MAKTLPAGVFTIAKAGVAYVRYSVAARMHSIASVDGQYDNVQSLSDGAVIDGVTRDKGWFRYSFSSGGTTYGTLEGGDAPVGYTSKVFDTDAVHVRARHGLRGQRVHPDHRARPEAVRRSVLTSGGARRWSGMYE